MLSPILTNLKSFREQIYQAIQCRADACMDLLDSLCSNTIADSPVKLSLNIHHRRSYNSITDVLSEFHKGTQEQDSDICKALAQQAVKNNQDREYYLFVTDCTPAPRVHSPTLSDRSIIYAPNPVAGNKPITIGHKYSVTGFLPPKDDKSAPWVLPLCTQRVSSEEDETLVGAEQLQKSMAMVTQMSPNKLFLNVVDSGYCKPEYIDKLHGSNAAHSDNLMTIVRARSNRVLWRQATEKRSRYAGKRGHELWYGDKFDFKNITTWHTPSQTIHETVFTNKGKECLVEIKGWDNMVMRQKRGVPMNNHPFTLFRVTMTDPTGKQIFHKPLWLMVFGKRRTELTSKEIYNNYLHRYDVEHFFRFEKGNLLADKLQTTNTQHEENWWAICALAYTILFVARLAAEKTPYPWEKYLPEVKKIDRIASPTQVQRAFHKLTRVIGTPAAEPKPRGNPLGRAVGEKQTKRKHHEVVIKSKSTTQKAAA